MFKGRILELTQHPADFHQVHSYGLNERVATKKYGSRITLTFEVDEYSPELGNFDLSLIHKTIFAIVPVGGALSSAKEQIQVVAMPTTITPVGKDCGTW